MQADRSGPAATAILLALLTIGGCAAPAQTVSSKPPPEEPAALSPSQLQEAQEREQEALVMAALDRNGSLYFARGSAEIDPAGEALLRRHAARLSADSKLRVTIVGHTDDLGSRSYNLAVAEKRVSAVYARLRALGVKSRQLRRYSAGSELTSSHCRSSECRRMMRRVELRYTEAR